MSNLDVSGNLQGAEYDMIWQALVSYIWHINIPRTYFWKDCFLSQKVNIGREIVSLDFDIH